MRLLTDILEKAVALVFPNRCLVCGKIIPTKYFCKDCLPPPELIPLKTCQKCGLPKKFCSCKFNFYYFDSIISCLEADEKCREAFYAYKFYGNVTGSRFFYEKMAQRIKEDYQDLKIDIVTFVPSHKSSVNERGFDQVKILAKGLAKLIKVKYRPLLCQPKKSQKQHKTVTVDERFRNVEGKYRFCGKSSIKGKTILLVDDIKTTGATLSQCAKELKLSGAEKVIVITALTVYPKNKDKENKPLKKSNL